MTLEGSNGGAWDQFAANEEKFGLKSDYHEEIYTTSLDRTSANYRQSEARAARIAREIESGGSKHGRARDEEEGEEDEEEKYVALHGIDLILRGLKVSAGTAVSDDR